MRRPVRAGTGAGNDGAGAGNDDDGVTMIEVVVALSIMSVFMAMFTVGMVQMFRSVNKNEALANAQSEMHVVVQRLDREIRYAAGISTPAAVGADAYVEYLTVNTGTYVCTELRLNVATAQLQRRTWVHGSEPLVPGPWIPLASGVTSATPFTMIAADASFNFQQLRISLVATAGGGNTAATRQTDLTFTALNTSLSTSSATLCTEGRAVP